MKKQICLLVTLILSLNLFVGCKLNPVNNEAQSSHVDISEISYDPISEYDEETMIKVEETAESGFIVRSKKYPQSDNGDDTLILSVENMTEKNYSIKITVSFFDTDGKKIAQQTKRFKGFPSGWQNFFIYRPKVNYETLSYTIEATEYTEPTYAQHILKNAAPINFYTQRTKLNPITNELLDDWYVMLNGNFQIANVSYEKEVLIAYERILFDNQGNICAYNILTDIAAPLSSATGHSMEDILNYGYPLPVEVSNVLWKNQTEYNLPDHLTGDVVGVVSVLGVGIE